MIRALMEGWTELQRWGQLHRKGLWTRYLKDVEALARWRGAGRVWGLPGVTVWAKALRGVWALAAW